MLNRKAVAERAVWLIVTVTFAIVVAYFLVFPAQQHAKARSELFKMDSTTFLWALDNHLSVCSGFDNLITQQCSSGIFDKNVFVNNNLERLVTVNSYDVGIKFTVPEYCDNTACEYNSDQLENPSCIKTNDCVYDRLRPGAKQKQILFKKILLFWDENTQTTKTINYEVVIQQKEGAD